jgi:hypothetical protein
MLDDAPQGFDCDGAVDRRVYPRVRFGEVLDRPLIHGSRRCVGDPWRESLDRAGHIRRKIKQGIRNIGGHQVPTRVEVRQRRQQLPRVVGEILQYVQIPAERVNRHAVPRPQPPDEFEHSFARVGLKIETSVERVEEHHRRIRHRFAEPVEPIGSGALRERSHTPVRTRCTCAKNVDALGLALIEDHEIVFGQALNRMAGCEPDALAPDHDLYFHQASAGMERCGLRIGCLKCRRTA